MVLDREWEKGVEEKQFLEEDQRVEREYLHRINDQVEKPKIWFSV